MTTNALETDALETSQDMYKRLQELHPEPYATVLCLSGGGDSLAAYAAAKMMGIRIDYLLHVRTGTGIAQTTEFVRQFAKSQRIPLILADAGDAYERYVLRKGFFGVGQRAHSFSWHVLKKQPLERGISEFIRQRRRNRTVILLNGARLNESKNRRQNLAKKGDIRPMQAGSKNVWANLIHHWSKSDCRAAVAECNLKTNPVSDVLCRSAECMCGTAQSQDDRREAAFWYPEWGAWLDDLEGRVTERFPWRWGETPPEAWKLEERGQLRLFDKASFQPMCSGCTRGLTQ